MQIKFNRLLFFLAFCLAFAEAQNQLPEKPKVLVMEIRDEINPPMRRYVMLALQKAENIKADLVIVDMDTFGGALTDAKDIADMILNFEKPVWVFINSDAASAGALISIACDSIYMSPGASIGAATVVNGTDGEAAPDKYQSYMRSIMRSTAQETGRNPDIAEGMVDENLEIDSIKPAGQVITLTTAEAIRYGFCEAKAESIDEILKRNNIKNYERVDFKLEAIEKIIAFFLNPAISGLLILIIIGGIYFEFQTPGIGFPLFAAIAALVLYLVPYYLNGLAENWEIIALFVGLLLLIAEIFFIPGFGIPGILGISLIISSLILIMLDNDLFNFDLVATGDVFVAAITAIGGLTGAAIVLFAGGSKLTKSRAFARMVNLDTQSKESGFTANFVPQISLGTTGTAHTILRPGGKVMIDEKVYDAFTRGEFIEKGEQVVVVDVEASTLKVKKA
ncbi:MAG: nodulation protein NfeD [Bacteroidetes bacterium]|nr:nodulation protein NfeD [Bacteroidota bacterium]